MFSSILAQIVHDSPDPTRRWKSVRGPNDWKKTNFGVQIVSSELIEFFVDDLDVRRDSLESKISPSNMLNSGNICRISRLKVPFVFLFCK